MTPENSRADALTPCVHADDPKACYRVRCQLGGKCVDDDMSPRQPAAAPIAENPTGIGYDTPLEELEQTLAAPSPADERGALSKDVIRAVFMAHGFTIKEGQTDLKQYVYDAAYALLARAASTNETGAEGANYRAGIEAVAKFIDKKAADYVDQFGYWEHDTGAVSWGSGNHADAKRDYHSSLVELAEEIRATLKGDGHA